MVATGAEPAAPARWRRRQVAMAATAVVGALLLGAGVAQPAGSAWFYGLTVLVAAVWISGAILADRLAPSAGGVLPLGRRAVLPPLLVAVAAYAFFAACSLLVRLVPPVQHALAAVLGHARGGSMVLVLAVAALNGAAEEVYFRGVLYQTVARTNPVLVTTTVYALVTAGTRNVALVLAAVVMGFIFARQRRVAGGLLAPVVTHLAWSLLMVLLLPR